MSLYKKESVRKGTLGCSVNLTLYVISLFNCEVLIPEIIRSLNSGGEEIIDVASRFLLAVKSSNQIEYCVRGKRSFI